MIGFRGRVFGEVVLFGGAFAALFAAEMFLLDAAVGQAGQEQDRAGCQVSVGERRVRWCAGCGLGAFVG
ncbi:hypothetical protein [Streptomyces nondiastaticus]|uniref:Uncharacterized protein n=1 Tax=Streptomyces nondiastaticus TaxID=3154512 RepID=A0ABW6U8M2_9ACTN